MPFGPVSASKPKNYLPRFPENLPHSCCYLRLAVKALSSSSADPSDPDSNAVVALYGEFGPDYPPPGHLPGRILIKGPDNGFHAGGGGGDFQANHFCLLTNEIVWVSQAVDSPPDYLVSKAVDNCVDNARDFLGLE